MIIEEIPFSWECPYCNKAATIQYCDLSRSLHSFKIKDECLGIITTIIICPNISCKKYTLKAFLHSTVAKNIKYTVEEFEQHLLLTEWQLMPSSIAKVFPDYIPQNILQDYKEACQILNLSPKASATLSRRCLQGMIRDFYGIRKQTLYLEIDELKSKIANDTWNAIDSLRKIGNIGAHMEKDVNIIIDVTIDEAKTLISLIEFLLSEWYIKRHDHEVMLKKITNIATAKKTAN